MRSLPAQVLKEVRNESFCKTFSKNLEMPKFFPSNRLLIAVLLWLTAVNGKVQAYDVKITWLKWRMLMGQMTNQTVFENYLSIF